MASSSGVYLGNVGRVDFRRLAPPDYNVTLLDEDVNATRRRFSFLGAQGILLTGDRVRFARQDGNRLLLLKGQTTDDVVRFVNVEDDGGIRLFDTYQEAVNGIQNDALELRDPRRNQDITVSVENETDTGFYRTLGKTTDWSLTTQRETVDTTSLGSEFRTQYEAGLISGQGSLTAMWDAEWDTCGNAAAPDEELSNYFCQLVLRVRSGARFGGRFYVRTQGELSPGVPDPAQNAVYWECDCICTNVSMAFSPTTITRTRIQFITTGPIQLHVGPPDPDDGFIGTSATEAQARAGENLAENEFLISQENGDLLLQGGYKVFNGERPTWE